MDLSFAEIGQWILTYVAPDAWIQVLLMIGGIWFFVKEPFDLFVSAILKAIPGTDDDRWYARVQKNKIYKAIRSFLDWTASIFRRKKGKK